MGRPKLTPEQKAENKKIKAEEKAEKKRLKDELVAKKKTETEATPKATQAMTTSYVYRSLGDGTKGLSVKGLDKSRRVHVLFTNGSCVLTQTLADTFGVDVVDLKAALDADPSFGIEFMQVAGPGFKETATVKAFIEVADKKVGARQARVVKGPRSTGG